MKFICTQKNLLDGLSRVVPVSGRNTQLPILQHVLLNLANGVMNLTCTDLEIGVHTIVLGKVEIEGTATVEAKKIMNYVQQIPDDNPITIELKKNNINISTKGFHASFPTGSHDDFPLLPEVSGDEVNVSGKDLCSGLAKTVFSAAKDETRPEIHSVFIKNNKEKTVLVATDSFRLAEKHISIENTANEFMFLLPLTSAQEVVRLFSGEEDVSLIPQSNHILFKTPTIELSSKLIDGKYPDYEQIIPVDFKTHGHVDKEQLVRALKTLMVFLPKDSHRVQLNINPGKSEITLVVDSESGAGDVKLSFDGEGDTLDVVFNIMYLIEGVQQISGDNVSMQFVGSGEPAVLRSDSKKEGYLYVVMPIQK